MQKRNILKELALAGDVIDLNTEALQNRTGLGLEDNLTLGSDTNEVLLLGCSSNFMRESNKNRLSTLSILLVDASEEFCVGLSGKSADRSTCSCNVTKCNLRELLTKKNAYYSVYGEWKHGDKDNYMVVECII